ncbi:MAG TPA: histidine phosphatase family protein [Candidatus Saccharimonadia bacterium]|jgi:broad specificity phosphatase PhoE
MRLTVVRHGETIENREHIIQGQNPGQLTARGREQAQEVAQQLRVRLFNAMFSSDLTRCVDTLDVIHEPHPTVPTYLSTKLREISFGEYQGKPSMSLNWQLLEGTALTKKAPGGESWTDLSERVLEFLNEIYDQRPDEDVLVVAHGGPMRVIRAALGVSTLESLITEQIPNCAVWDLEMTEPVNRGVGNYYG